MGLFDLTEDAASRTVSLSLNADSRVPLETDFLSIGETVTIADTFGKRGWLEWDAAPNRLLELTMTFSGKEANWEDFTEFFDLVWEESGYTTVFDAQNQAISVSGMFSGDVLAWDFSPFNETFGADYTLLSVGSVEVPEPATWFLLLTFLLGMGLFSKRGFGIPQRRIFHG